MTSNNAFTEKNEKQYVRLQLNIPGTYWASSNTFARDIDGFTDEPVVQREVQVAKNTFYL